ncbi:MAG: gluconate 2-dehydrogenase subunit 3 family protein [Flavobacteriaceae bacterium]
MKRRNALKNIGLAMGYSVATPTLVSIVQSCNKEAAVGWRPSFFSPEEGHILKLMVDIFLPKTDTPSASELNVHIFIDGLADKVMYNEEEFLTLPLAKQNIENIEDRWIDTGYFVSHSRDFFKKTMSVFVNRALNDSDKEDIPELNAQDLEKTLETVYSKCEAEKETREKVLQAYIKGLFTERTSPPLNDDQLSCVFAESLRDMTIMGYKTNEYIGENVLAYQPIPGEYIACGDLDELTGGKAYSIVW